MVLITKIIKIEAYQIFSACCINILKYFSVKPYLLIRLHLTWIRITRKYVTWFYIKCEMEIQFYSFCILCPGEIQNVSCLSCYKLFFILKEFLKGFQSDFHHVCCCFGIALRVFALRLSEP